MIRHRNDRNQLKVVPGTSDPMVTVEIHVPSRRSSQEHPRDRSFRTADAPAEMESGYMAQQLPDILVSEFADDPEMAQLVETFVAVLPERAAAIEDALFQWDLDVLLTLAHQLKGTGGSYGFPSITEAAARLEETAKTKGDLAKLQEQVDALVDLCMRAARRPRP
jgi:HPt (histidine-containing phosphotransfer) domain-containing protein